MDCSRKMLFVVILVLTFGASLTALKFNIYFVMIDDRDTAYYQTTVKYAALFTNPKFTVRPFDVRGKLYSPTLYQDVNSLLAETNSSVVGAVIGRYEPVLSALFSGVPYFVIFSGTEQRCTDIENGISVLPPAIKITQTITKLMAGSQDAHVTLIGDDADSISAFILDSEELFKKSKSDITKHAFHPVYIDKTVTGKPLRDMLTEVRDLGYTKIILLSSDLQSIRKIINASTRLDMMTSLYSWYLTYLNTKDLPNDLKQLLQSQHSNLKGLNIISSNVAYGSDSQKKLDISNVKAEERVLYSTMLDSISVMASAARELQVILAPGIEYLSYIELNKYNLSWINSNDIRNPKKWLTGNGTITGDGFCRNVDLGVYGTQYGKDFTQLQSVISEEDDNNDFITISHLRLYLKPPYSPLFYRNPIKVVTRPDPPFVFAIKDKGNETRYPSGMLVDYMDAYAQHLNFNYTIYLVQDNEMGHFSFKHGWNGMVRDIRTGKADIAAGAFSIDVNRSRVIDYTEATIPGTLTLLMQAPNIDRTIWQFLQPFDTYLWLLILGVLFTMSFLLTLLTRIDFTTDTISFSDSFYHIAAILTQGSSETNPTSIPSRIMIAFVMFFAIVFNASYTANMTAFLTLRNEDVKIKTLDSLSTQGKIIYGVVNGSEAMNVLQRIKTNPSLLLWSTISRQQSIRILPSYEVAIEKISKENFVLISESVITNYYVDVNCGLIAIPQDTFTVRYALGIPLGLPIKVKLDEAIAKVRETDEDSRIKMKYYQSNKGKCPDRASTTQTRIETKPLTAGEMVGVFVTLTIGAGLSLLAAIIGHIVVRYKEKNSRNENITVVNTADDLSAATRQNQAFDMQSIFQQDAPY